MVKRLTGYGKTATNFYGLAEELKARSDWRMGKMWAEWAYGCRSYGELPHEYHYSVSHADYVIYSYDTPIAWHDANNEWVVPEVNYSVTTSRHQGRIITALSVM